MVTFNSSLQGKPSVSVYRLFNISIIYYLFIFSHMNDEKGRNTNLSKERARDLVLQVGVPMEDDSLFCEDEHKHHLLYSGTEVLQVRGAEELPALVIKTGSATGSFGYLFIDSY